MLTVIIGNDSVGILNFIKSKKTAFGGQEIIEINSKNSSNTDIEDLSNSLGMFSVKKLIIIKAESTGDIDFKESFLSSISTNQDVEILIDASGVIKTTKAYKLLTKFAKKFSFEQKRNYDVYNISDAFFSGKKSLAIDLLLSKCKTDDDFYSILSAIHFGLKNLVAKEHNNKSWDNLHPFIKKKLTNVKVDKNKLK